MMLDPFDYKEPRCPECSGEEFYYYDANKQQGSIPIQNVITKLDSYLNKEKYSDAKKLLEYWLAEAEMLKDPHGMLSILSEIMGLSRKINEKDWGLKAVEKAFDLIESSKLTDTVSAGTFWLNGATTMKAFGKPKEAVEYFNKALKVYNKYLDKNDALFGGLYNNMALNYVDIGEYQLAKKYYDKAIEIMKDKPNGYLDIAISYANIADLYDISTENSQEVCDKYMMMAYDALNRPDLIKNGYYAFVCRKCAPVFGYYGYFTIKNELEKRADMIYEGN